MCASHDTLALLSAACWAYPAPLDTPDMSFDWSDHTSLEVQYGDVGHGVIKA